MKPEVGQFPKVGHPAVANGFGDDASESRVCQQQPAPWGHAVGLVVEPFRKHLGQVFYGQPAQQLRVNRRDPVGAMRAGNSKVGHANPALGAVLDQAHALDALLIARKAGSHGVEKATVDLENYLQMSRQHHLEPGKRPLFEGFGQQRVVRVRQCPFSNFPGLVPCEAGLIEQDAHQFRHSHSRVGIVQLDGDLFGELSPIGIAAAKTPHQVG